jgi:putative endonuclease
MEREPFVYMLASRRHGTLYTGVTSNLPQRIWQHRTGVLKGFSSRYGVRRLVWFEQHETMDAAIVRERRIKEWQRPWKVRLIETEKPILGRSRRSRSVFPLTERRRPPSPSSRRRPGPMTPPHAKSTRPHPPRHPGEGRDP